MNSFLRLNKTAPVILIAFFVVCPELSPKTQIISPPRAAAPPSLNKPEKQKALFSPKGGTWEVVPSPNTGSPHNYFYGVAAIAPNDVWAVGGFGDLTTRAQQLVQHWDGQNWIMVPTPTLPTTYNEISKDPRRRNPKRIASKTARPHSSA